MEGISIATIADITKALSNYDFLANCFPQLDPSQRETLLLVWENALKYSKDGKHMDHNSFRYWQNIDFHLIEQSWSSTACGWEGIGGQAFTDSYTLVIENKHNKCIFVYYNGVLAYVAVMDEKLEKFSSKMYKNLPGISSCKTQLTIAYINKNKR